MLGHLSYERSSSILYVEMDWMVIIGHRYSKNTFCANKKKRKLDPVGSTVRYEMMKLCAGSVVGVYACIY